MKAIKTLAVIFIIALLLPSVGIAVSAENTPVSADVPSYILMEAETRTVLGEYNADEARHPASVTKVMTLLLVMEAIDTGKIKLTDMVSVSEHAASMGGTQIYLEVGEQMSVGDMIKAVTVCSANDAAAALGEFVSGSEEAFVALMNKRAGELGMKSTHFENTNGLDDTTNTHLTSARDIAIMSAELLSHKKILDYSTIWQDTVRNGEFTVTNTNKLIRFYSGANGLKTGFTSKSGYCVSATAKRNGLQLIAVIMGAETSDKRNVAAKKLLDYGFANYAYVEIPAAELEKIAVKSGVTNSCGISHGIYRTVLQKADASKITCEYVLPENIKAPVSAGMPVGKVIYKCGTETVGEVGIFSDEDIDRITYFGMLLKTLKKYFLI